MTSPWSEIAAFVAGGLVALAVRHVIVVFARSWSSRREICAYLKVGSWDLIPLIRVVIAGTQRFAGSASDLPDMAQDSDPSLSLFSLGEMRTSQAVELTIADQQKSVAVPSGPGHMLIVDVPDDHTVESYFLDRKLDGMARDESAEPSPGPSSDASRP